MPLLEEPLAQPQRATPCMHLLPPEVLAMIVVHLGGVDCACLRQALGRRLQCTGPPFASNGALRVGEVGSRPERWQWAVSTGLQPAAAVISGARHLVILSDQSTLAPINSWPYVSAQLPARTQRAAFEELYGRLLGPCMLALYRGGVVVCSAVAVEAERQSANRARDFREGEDLMLRMGYSPSFVSALHRPLYCLFSARMLIVYCGTLVVSALAFLLCVVLRLRVRTARHPLVQDAELSDAVSLVEFWYTVGIMVAVFVPLTLWGSFVLVSSIQWTNVNDREPAPSGVARHV